MVGSVLVVGPDSVGGVRGSGGVPLVPRGFDAAAFELFRFVLLAFFKDCCGVVLFGLDFGCVGEWNVRDLGFLSQDDGRLGSRSSLRGDSA